MNREHFIASHEQLWSRFSDQLDELADGSVDPDLASLPRNYRCICHHLAVARSRSYGIDLVDRLNQLAVRGHAAIYQWRPADRRRLLTTILHDFPRRLRQRPGLFLAAVVLMTLPQILGHVLVLVEPELARVFLGESTYVYEEMYATPESAEGERPAETDVMMFGFYVYNNVSIAFRTYASGLLAGIGTVFYLVFNGLTFGAVSGHLENLGLASNLYPFVAGHSPFELTAIWIAGAAGLSLAHALWIPGRHPRWERVRRTARQDVPLILGLVVMLILAAFVEAFWSSTPTAPHVRYAVGAVLALLVACFLLFAGKNDG